MIPLAAACANFPMLQGSPEIICAAPKNNPTIMIKIITFFDSKICKVLDGCHKDLKNNLIEVF